MEVESSEEEQLPLWDPDTAHCLSDLELSQYLLVASSCAVGGGSHNEEVALQLLQKHQGNVQQALQELLATYELEEDALSLFGSQESDSEDEMASPGLRMTMTRRCPWQPLEVDLFYEGLVRYHKDFTKVSRHVGTKSVKDCVEFYYLWKNICFEESQSFKSLFAQSLNHDPATTGQSSISSDQQPQPHPDATAVVHVTSSVVAPSSSSVQSAASIVSSAV